MPVKTTSRASDEPDALLSSRVLVYRPVHELPAPPARLWQLYLDPAFQRTLFVEGLGWAPPDSTITKDDETELLRITRATPNVELPGPIARLVKQTLGYTEEGRFDKRAQVFHMRHRTNVFGDRVRLEGRFRLDPVGDDRCRRVGHVEVEAHVLGVGGLLERVVELNMKKGWDQSARFLARWLAEHPA